MESVQSQVVLSFAKQAKYHSVSVDLKVKGVTQKKDQNSSEGTQKCSNNFGHMSILLKLAGLGKKTNKPQKKDPKAKLCPGFVPQFDIPLTAA